MLSLRRSVAGAAVAGILTAGIVGVTAAPAAADSPIKPCPQTVASHIIGSGPGGAAIAQDSVLTNVVYTSGDFLCTYYSPRIEEYTTGAASNPVRVYSGSWSAWSSLL